MPACASPLRFLGVGLMGGSLAGQAALGATDGQGRPALWGPSILQKALPVARRMAILQEFLVKYNQARHPLDPPMMRDQDVALDIFVEGGKMKTPYERGAAWEPCMFSRWAEPDCIPGIGTKVYTDTPMTDREWDEALTKSLQPGKCPEATTRPYILVVHGNDQYVSVYPDYEEIGPDHPHRKRVEAHFAERGLKHLTETPTVKWAALNGQGSNPGGTGPGTGGDRHGASPDRDTITFRARLFAGLGVPTEFFIPPTGFLHTSGPEAETPRPQAQDGDGGKPPG